MTDVRAQEGSVAARNSVKLVLDRVFGSYFWALNLATWAVWIHSIVSVSLAYQLTKSTLVVGLVTAAQWSPQIVLAPLSGAMADRGNLRRQILLGRSLTIVGSGGLAVWIAAVGAEALPVPALVGAGLVLGIGFAIGGPALNAMLPLLVRPSELPQAVALYNLPGTLARVAGPVLGVAIMVSAGPAQAFAMAAAAHIVFALVIRTLPLERMKRTASNVKTSLLGGFRYLCSDIGLLVLIFGTAAVSIGADPAITLVPSLSEKLGDDQALVGVLAASFGVGAMAGYPVLSVSRRLLGRVRISVGGAALLAISTAVLVVVDLPWLACVLLGLAGIGMTTAVTSFSTMMYERVAEEYRGRVMALWTVALTGSRALAGTMNGLIVDAFSLEAALAVCSALVLVAAYLLRRLR
ncbi:MFS transporter [Microbispora sp. CA-102843]|uniref:MFS transporter n=1 Tax=Microbispora sp. CA-102843 TaxID=3239952 RepID=UPI003D8DE69D